MQISHFSRELPGDINYDYRDWKVAKCRQLFGNYISFFVQARGFYFYLNYFLFVCTGIC